MQRFFQAVFWLAVAVTLYLTLRPITIPVPGSDKTHHMIAFGLLTLLAGLGYARAQLFALGAVMSGFGALIEFLQPRFGRSADIRDWIADSIGIALAILLLWTLRKLLLRRRNPAL